MIYESYEDDGETPLFYATARANEAVFRNVLRHVKLVSWLVPHEFDTEAPIDELLERVNPYNAVGRFAVGDFLVGPREKSGLNDLVAEKVGRLAANQAVIAFGNHGPAHGSDSVFLYNIQEDGGLRFHQRLAESLV